MHTLDDEIGSKDTHGRDTDAGLCGSIGGAEAGEDNGGGAAHGTEKGLWKNMSVLLCSNTECSSNEFILVPEMRHRVRDRSSVPHIRDYRDMDVSNDTWNSICRVLR